MTIILTLKDPFIIVYSKQRSRVLERESGRRETSHRWEGVAIEDAGCCARMHRKVACGGQEGAGSGPHGARTLTLSSETIWNFCLPELGNNKFVLF